MPDFGAPLEQIEQDTPMECAICHKKEIGKARCVNRLSAIDFMKEHFGIEIKKTHIVCHYSARNSQCFGKRCPFSPLKVTKH